MYLKNISAYGFKSFADKTEFNLDKNITGIVGPNGSGKSNIVDAVKWVLGEQSTKSLRATGKMTDVIFSGSKTREPFTKASVSLVFNNDDRYLNCDYSEIEIKRVLFNDGENEYYLNNSKVRLKDITDLFIDSGASKETFNIISQGEVQEIIDLHPNERRIIFEEAAGVLKYKKRKEESLRKLDKTTDNLSRINLIINELSLSLEPLRLQSEIASRYLNLSSELKNIEVALIANDITSLNNESNSLIKAKETLEQKILLIETMNKKDTSKIEKMKLNNLKLEENITKLNEKIMKLIDEISNLESEKRVVSERKNYSVNNDSLANNLLKYKEEELIIKNNVELIKKDLEILNKDLTKITDTKKEEEIYLNNLKLKRDNYLSDYRSLNQNINNLDNKINIIKHNLQEDTGIPYAVRNVLNNPRLKGIHNVLGRLISVNSEYSTAIDTILGFNQNVIVVDNETSAKEAINYLKDNSLGRATFFPLNVIKPRYIEIDILNRLKEINGFIDIASNLVTNDNIYDNIVKNQLGNVIVTKNIDSLNLIGKIINYRYRIVSLDGEILHTGGSLTGGKVKETYSMLEEKNNLLKYEKELSALKNNSKELELNIKNINEEINLSDLKFNNILKELTVLEEKNHLKLADLNNKEADLKNKLSAIKGIKNIKDNTLDKELENILKTYYEKVNEKEIVNKELEDLKKQKRDLFNEITNEEKEYHEYNSEFNKINNELKDKEIALGKIGVKLDNLLLTLNENYQLTYENACNNYQLDLEESIARLKVNSLKQEIKTLGEVNIGSISEFERINKRYTFLSTQKEDLELSVNNLKEIITEMDQIMIDKFTVTFNLVKDEFTKVYKILFRGGDAKLILTDKDNILETGVEIIASPPGKKLNSIALLSGGEKALTSLSLLFAILNIKPAPFCILDEVEDALDDANVDVFGKYINSIKDKTQFILITHKKRTMEYADTLFGITMQESGVSKIVNVKLT